MPGVLLLVLATAPAHAQPRPSLDELLDPLASRIALAVAPAGSVRLVVDGPDAAIAGSINTLLATHGIRVAADAGTAVSVRVACLDNLRDHACVAEIRNGDGRQVVAVTRPRETRTNAIASVGLDLQPVLASASQILDVLTMGDTIVALGRGTVSLYPRVPIGSGEAVRTRAVSSSRPWSRDLRGRLRATSGNAFEAFLPGVTCRGTVDPFVVSCAEESESWPIGIENHGMTPGRNTFTTPEGWSFLSVASLGAAGEARWLAADEHGTLVFLNDRRDQLARGGAADEVIGLTAPCGAGSYVVTSGSTTDSPAGDVLRLVRATENRQLLATPVTMTLAGRLAALWAAPGADRGTAVVHNLDAGRYEAFQIALSCAR